MYTATFVYFIFGSCYNFFYICYNSIFTCDNLMYTLYYCYFVNKLNIHALFRKCRSLLLIYYNKCRFVVEILFYMII